MIQPTIVQLRETITKYLFLTFLIQIESERPNSFCLYKYKIINKIFYAVISTLYEILGPFKRGKVRRVLHRTRP